MCCSFTLIEKTKDEIRLGFSQHVVHLQLNPFRIDVIAGNEPVMSINARGLLNFEHYRRRRSITASLLTDIVFI